MPEPAQPDIPGFLNAVGDVPAETDPVLVRQRSRDMSAAFSPVLKREAKDRSVDVILRPRSRDDVLRIAASAARHRMPLIARGGGTANFGQGIPLRGGALIDMTALDKVLWVRGPVVRAEAGVRMVDVDAATRPTGWELRMHPSTKRAGTLGGYLGGGHAGVGSCAYGILRDRGNILGLQVVSVEEEPRVVELRGTEVNLVHHAYGANGLILEAEMPLAPAWEWMEAVVCFKDFMTATRFSHAVSVSDGIVKKLVSLHQWPLPKLMTPLSGVLREGEDMVLCMIAAPFFESFETLVEDFGGTITARAKEGEGPYGIPIYEFAWGHTRFHVNKVDRSLVGCVGLYRDPDLVEKIERSYRRFAKLGPMHFEAKRFDGGLSFQGSPLFPYVDDAQLAAVTAAMQEDGAIAANNHTFLVRENGMKPVDDIEIAFKRGMDPYDLLNPGKLAIDAASVAASAGAKFGAKGWTYAGTPRSTAAIAGEAA
ncbi:FAD-binding oxidoreductase [Roseomonas sp. OT10]|uniref:FAD-binding oxidoreductase n=1 Tax=Roseomonas cutis TaxID=2897332 RepID=UPI001E55BC7A|nr:FAD-binding oxidoreductase [Roseomonas sp. OT10]UFN49534.1 FAD-binding oxidoreductase [Roseomonas sp. OT10]